MDQSVLSTLLDRYGDRFAITPSRLGRPVNDVFDWPELTAMLDAYIDDHPEGRARLYCDLRNDGTQIVEAVLKADPTTIWRWRNPETPRSATARVDQVGTTRGRGRPRRALSELVQTAAELRLVNGPTWPAGRSTYGKTHLQRRLDITADQARERVREAKDLTSTDPEFAAAVDQATTELRRTLTARIAAATIEHSVSVERAAELVGPGIPLDKIDGLTADIDTAITEITDTAAQLRTLLPGGAVRATTTTVATWRAGHPDADTGEMLRAAQTHATAVAAGEAKKATAAKWLQAYSAVQDQAADDVGADDAS